MKFLIIGGGIAGLSFAMHLHSNGYEVTVLEKDKVKKTKLCGGLLTGKAIHELKSLGLEYEDIIFKPKEIKIYDEKKLLISFENDINVFLVDRKELDTLLLNKFINDGGSVLFDKNIIDIDTSKKQVKSAENEIFEYDTLVIANGANSGFRKLLNEDASEKAFCVEQKIPRNTDLSKQEQEKVSSIDIKFIKNRIGYAWIFENYHETIEGIGFRYNDSEVKKEFGRFFTKNSIKGAYVPFGKQPNFSKTKDVFFVGDAGGYVNPLLAEGISYSIASGRAIANIIKHNDYNLDNRLRESISSFLTLRNIFYSKFNFFFKRMIKNHPGYAEYVCKNLILNDDYNVVNINSFLKGYREYKSGRRQ